MVFCLCVFAIVDDACARQQIFLNIYCRIRFPICSILCICFQCESVLGGVLVQNMNEEVSRSNILFQIGSFC